MCLGDTFFGEWIFLVDLDLQLAFSKVLQQQLGVVRAFFWGSDVVPCPTLFCSVQAVDGIREAYTGRTNLTFLGPNFRGEKSGGTPEAFPTATIVPLRRIDTKLSSHLGRAVRKAR